MVPLLLLISPVGGGTYYQDMVALVHNDKKWWLSEPEYRLLGSPEYEEVSYERYDSIPDGVKTICVNGLNILPKSTLPHIPKTDSWKYSSMAASIAIIFVIISVIIGGRK